MPVRAVHPLCRWVLVCDDKDCTVLWASLHHFDEDADQHGHNQSCQCQNVKLVSLYVIKVIVHDFVQCAFNLCDSFF